MKAQEGPDQKWSWVVAGGCFFICLVFYGIYKTSGILLVAFVYEFQETREDASWPLVLCFSLVDLIGLIVGPLGHKFGVRPITIAGALMSVAGVSLCYFAASLQFITISFGVLFGCGFGFATTLIPVIINEYFVKYRVTANGIALSGACFGSVIFPPVYEFLLSTYELNGCLLLTGGIILHVVIAGILMRPPSWLIKTKGSRENSPNQYELVTGGVEDHRELYECARNSTENGSENNPECLSTAKPEISVFQKQCKTHIDPQRNVEDHSKSKEGNYDSEKMVVGSFDATTLADKTSSDCPNAGHRVAQYVDPKCLIYSKGSSKITQNNVGLSQNVLNPEISDSPRSKDDMSEPFTQTVLNNIQDDEKSPFLDTKTAKTKVTPKRSLAVCERAANCAVEKTTGDVETVGLRTDVERVDEESHFGILESFKIVLSCPMFYIIGLSHVIFFSCEEMFYVICADFYIDQNTAEDDVKYMFMIQSLGELIGSLCFGWVTDGKYLSRSHFMTLALLAIAVVYLVFPFANVYVFLLVMNCAFGLMIGMTTIVLFVLPADYLDMEIQAVACGAIAFLRGTLTLTCSLLIGHFRDNVGSYSSIFYIMGALCVGNAVFWIFEKYFASCSFTSKKNRSRCS